MMITSERVNKWYVNDRKIDVISDMTREKVSAFNRNLSAEREAHSQSQQILSLSSSYQ